MIGAGYAIQEPGLRIFSDEGIGFAHGSIKRPLALGVAGGVAAGVSGDDGVCAGDGATSLALGDWSANGSTTCALASLDDKPIKM